ncbi:MAG: NAD(P)H-dependent oxidoreductase [Pseudomonas sp.]|uniref:NADPH-dependent FMN reductase n=1 Tax=Pseudomonas sp. TaxID=306 RepID=UPI0033919C48
MSRHITLLAGSSRGNSQSLKVASYLRQRLASLGLCDSTALIDLGTSRLPLWPDKDANNTWSQLRTLLQEATALIVISPEWNGMACPALKNLFLYAGLGELGHKPALLVGVSAGLGGAYPLSELRAYSYKNCRIAYLPEQLVVRHVECMFNEGEPQDEQDARLRARADWALQMLCQYDQALQNVRRDIDLFHPDFANGM